MFFLKNRSSSLFVLLLLVTTACAAKRHDLIDAEKVGEADETESDFVASATRIGDVHLLPDSIYKKLETLINKGSQDHGAVLSAVKEHLCGRDNRPRAVMRLDVNVIVPKSPEGTPLDVAADRKAKFLETARTYLKHFAFDDLADLGIAQEKYNSDFKAYRECVANDTCRLGWNRPDYVFIPVEEGREKKQLEERYKANKFLPTIPAFHLDPSQWFIQRHLFMLHFSNRTAVMLPKVTDIVAGIWADAGNRGLGAKPNELHVEFIKGKNPNEIQLGDQATHNLTNQAHYAVSTTGWKLKDGKTYYPKHIVWADDLAFLKNNFSFVFDAKTIERLFKISEAGKLQYFGYDMDSNFSASTAIENREYIWSRVLQNQTKLTEKAEPWGARFTVEFFLDLFCSNSASLQSLQSR